jgi:hypothetical protein
LWHKVSKTGLSLPLRPMDSARPTYSSARGSLLSRPPRRRAGQPHGASAESRRLNQVARERGRRLDRTRRPNRLPWLHHLTFSQTSVPCSGRCFSERPGGGRSAMARKHIRSG